MTTTPGFAPAPPLVRRLFLLALLPLLCLAPASRAGDGPFKPVRIVDGVYALVGSTDGRTYENHALNANMGFVVTDAGVVLIDSGATPVGAALIAAAIAEVTDRPVRRVLNTGSQDHRWLGNSYFVERGAEVTALQRTVETQRRHAEAEMARLRGILDERAEGVTPAYAASPVEGERAVVEHGGKRMELVWLGDAHFPGDAVVWLPDDGVVFTGDLVYVERMLGVLPESRVVDWRAAFGRLESMAPRHLVPGHGNLANLERARRETGDYLDWLIEEVGARIEAWEELDETVEALSDAPRFRHLRHYESLHRANVNRTYLQLEAAR